jgi:hypothetical protein
MSKKGVCRHRAYAFMVTATALGLRSRVVMNEAHAWVEVWDGVLWKRIDLGGAGTVLDESPHPEEPRYAPPPDPFDWPAGAKRGEDLGRTGSGSSSGNARGGGNGGGAGTGGARAPATPKPAPTSAAADAPPDTRPFSVVTLASSSSSAARGQPVGVSGTVAAEGLPCGHTVVVISVREGQTGAVYPLGSLATRAAGTYAGSVVVPGTVDVGDYELFASTAGDVRCGPGDSLR